ncbi:PilT/PilU family type 4a pilus ATPase [bacterium]|nr:PilT/PilU family type 4a pilus ATPase [bacterium]
MQPNEGKELITKLLDTMVSQNGADLYLTVGVPPCMRTGDRIVPIVQQQALTPLQVNSMARYLVPDELWALFERDLEFNYAFPWNGQARFRLNLFRQQQQNGMVIRHIKTIIPTLADLNLPAIYGQFAMRRAGLVLVVGKAGVGKSSSLAAMIDHRNRNGHGHIITVEDPLEFVHTPNRCLFTQRDVGIDTRSFAGALKNALRQRPDVIMVGEIRDIETMELAIAAAESGHLCLATLHADSANHTIERVLDMYDAHDQHRVLKSLAHNLSGILAQRLVDTLQGGKIMVPEILINEGGITQLIMENKVGEIKEIMGKSRGQGMCTFDQSLLDQVVAGRIHEDTALQEADSRTDLQLKLRQWYAEHKQSGDAGGAGYINNQF